MRRHIFYNTLNLAGRGLNFILFWFIANKLGASFGSDWFFYLYGIVYFFISITFYSIECSLVPTWPGLSQTEKNGVFRTALFIGVTFLLPLQIIGILLSLFTPQLFGFQAPVINVQVVLLSILLFVQPVLAFYASVCSSYLQARGRYILPIVHLTIRTVGVFIILLLTPTSSSIFNITIAYTIGELFRTLILAVATRSRVSFTAKTPSDTRYLSVIYKNVGMMTMMTCSVAINPYIDIVMAGNISAGSATLVEYATKMRGLPYLALNGLLVVILGDWARNYGEKIRWQTVRKVTFIMTGLGILFSILFIFAKETAIAIFFQKGILSSLQIDNMNSLLKWYILGIPFMISGNILSRGLLIKKKFTILFKIGLFSTFCNILFNSLFIKQFNVTGIAISTTAVDFFSLIALYIITRKVIFD